MKIRHTLARPLGILAMGLVLLGGSFFFTIPQAHAQSVAATTSVSSHIEVKPVGFFEKMKLLFTFSPEKKADLLQNFSNRNFELAKQKLEIGNTEEAAELFMQADIDIQKASKSIAKIWDEDMKDEALASLSVIKSNRIQALTAVQAKVENSVAKEAIQNAILRAGGDAKVDAEAKASENKGVSASGNTSANLGTVVSGGPIAKCLPTSTPSVTVVSPNGGETYTAGQQITVKWKTCNLLSTDQVAIGLLRQGTNGFSFVNDGSGRVYGLQNDGVETFTLPLNESAGLVYKIDVDVTRVGQLWDREDVSDSMFTINGSSLGNSGGISLSCFVSPEAGETWQFGSTNSIQLVNPPIYNSHCSNTFSLVKASNGQRVAYLGIQSQLGQSSYSWTVSDTMLSFSCGSSGDSALTTIPSGQYKIRFEEQNTVTGIGQPISCDSGVITLD